MWEEIVRDESRGGCSKLLVDLDIKYLEQQGKQLSYGQYAARWGWGKSKVYRHLQSKSPTETKPERKRNEKKTAKPATVAKPTVKVKRTRHVRETLVERPSIKSSKKRKEEINKPVKKPAPKRDVIAAFCELHKSVCDAKYEVSGKDLGVTTLLASKWTEDSTAFKAVAERYLQTKQDKGTQAWIGSCPPGRPSLRQLADYYSEFAVESDATISVRGTHGKAERRPSKLF